MNAFSDGEVYVAPGTLLRSVNEAFDRFRTGSSSLVSVENETYPSDSEKSQDSSRSSSSATSSNESLKHFQEKPNLSESINTDASKEKDIEVNTADLKKHLTLEHYGKPRVSSWTGLQQDTLGLFLKGDQILAVNDLHTVSRDEFDMLVSKSLKDKVKVTILRLSGGHGDSGNSV
ncbi:hypothetical protein FQA47_019261 [Oryzias melastigma]|uniref:PDZ domain-containing protein n=1 Tax=Oryzias melastigma TaxID=30732 RepID=A0A834CE20_ORYME|nr:hypothetical protein FQA47_019261 [Oryzias melastigma]